MVAARSIEEAASRLDAMTVVRPALAVTLAAGLLCSSAFPALWPTALMLLVIGAPLDAFGIYISTLRRIHAFSAFSEESVIRRYLPGTWLRLVLGWLIGLMAAAVMATHMIGFGPLDWLSLALSPPVFLAVLAVAGAGLSRELRPCYRVGWSLLAAVVPASLILVGLRLS